MPMHQSDLVWIESQRERMISLVAKWACVNSWSDNLIGLSKMLTILIEDFAILEGEISILPLAKHISISSQGLFIDKPAAQALFIKKRPQAPIQILLGGHM